MVCGLENNVQLLRALLNLKPQQRLAILKSADKEVVRCLCECALNLLKGKVPVSPIQKKKLVPFKKILRKLVLKKGGWKNKRKVLLQRGGNFIPFILGPILSTVLSSVLN